MPACLQAHPQEGRLTYGAFLPLLCSLEDGSPHSRLNCHQLPAGQDSRPLIGPHPCQSPGKQSPWAKASLRYLLPSSFIQLEPVDSSPGWARLSLWPAPRGLLSPLQILPFHILFLGPSPDWELSESRDNMLLLLCLHKA